VVFKGVVKRHDGLSVVRSAGSVNSIGADRPATELNVSKSRTQVTVRERTRVQTRIREADLSDLEQQVMRMRYGIGVEMDAELEQRGQDNPEVARRLAAIEERAVSHLCNSEDLRRKQAIIEQLRKL